MFKRTTSAGLLATTILGAAALAAAPAHAQDADGSAYDAPIVVTAQRREEAAVDVPISVTSLGSDQLTTANVEELMDISKLTPSLRFDYQGGFVQPTIRGIGTAVTTSGGGSNVGIYVDGFYSANPLAANFQLMNVESIQVLKGPQGTLFGRNTTGGAILIQSVDPSTETGGELKASFGRFNELRTQGYATFGISDRVAIDVEGLYRRGDGWIRDIATGSKDAGDYESWSVRLGLKAELSDSVSLLLRYSHMDVDDPTNMVTNAYVDRDLGVAIAGFAPAGTFTTDPNAFAPGKDRVFLRSNSDVVQATIKADLGFADLTSYSQYRHEEVDSALNSDRTALTLLHLGLPNYNETWSQEFLLTSKPGTALQWTAGLFYFSNRDTYVTFLENNLATVGRVRLGGSSTTTKTYAAFLDATYELTPELFVTGGLRYARDVVDDAYYNAPTGARTPLDIAGFGGIDPDILRQASSGSLQTGSASLVVPNVATGIGAGEFSNVGKLGFKSNPIGTINMGLNTIGTLGGLYASLKQLSLANKQFKFQKEFAETNLANQMKSYNTSLADRARARAAFEGQSDSQRDAYVEQNRLR